MAEQNSSKQEKRYERLSQKDAERKASQRKKIFRTASIWLVGILFFLGIGFGISKLSAPVESNSLLASGISLDDNFKGNSESSVVLVEYSDFQCPACGAYYPLLKALVEEFGSEMQFVYRHFPLPQHQHAELAGRAAEAAGQQGKFWEMHDLIFENQTSWANLRNTEEVFTQYAVQLGLDMEKFKTDLDSKELKEKVRRDYSSGLSSGVNSTPTFFLNGVKLQNPRSYEEFRNAILNAL
jgi:protein-disulfide isomerase